MLLLLLAAAVAAQWTGPHTEEYQGPGYFCGGGYAIRLARGDRALVLPQSASAGIQGVRLVLGGREVNLWSGTPRQSGRIVARYGETVVTEHNNAETVRYSVSDSTAFALELTSSGFRGFANDRWFFARADFSSAAEQHVHCLAATSY